MLHFCLILQVPSLQLRNIFLILNQTLSQPVCLWLHQFYSQIMMHFYNVYCLQYLFLENNTVHKFQLKSFKHNVILLKKARKGGAVIEEQRVYEWACVITLLHLVSRFACKTKVIVDASSNPPVSHTKSL